MYSKQTTHLSYTRNSYVQFFGCCGDIEKSQLLAMHAGVIKGEVKRESKGENRGARCFSATCKNKAGEPAAWR